MALNTFGSLLAYDPASRSGVAGTLGTVVDPSTGVPVETFDLDGNPAPVVTNASGFVDYFKVPDLLRVEVSFGHLKMSMVAVEAVLAASASAVDAAASAAASAQAAIDASHLVGAPADEVVAAIASGPTTLTRIVLDSLYADKATLDAATPNATASTAVMRDASGRAKFADPAVAADAATKGYADATFVAKNAQVANVMDYGAKGDGTTNDTTAIQAAIDSLTAGGTLFYPPKSYVQGAVTLRSNVRIVGYGATILSTGYNIFRGLSGSTKGYGGSVRNVTFEGLIFKGNFLVPDIAAAITIHHGLGISFIRCKWVEAVLGGHGIDLGGRKDVLVDDCRFTGFNPPAGREYAEAIQIDHSTASGMSNMDAAASYDGLPCVNVKVQNSVFEGVTVNSVNYYAPNPIGSHVSVEKNHRNIQFINNVVDNPFPSASFSSITAPIHFQGVESLKVCDNKFYGSGAASSVIKLLAFTTGLGSSEYANPSPVDGPISAAITRDVEILRNEFFDFSSAENKALITVNGHASLRMNNITVDGNTFVRCFPAAGVGNTGSNMVGATLIDGLYVNDNKADTVRALVFATQVQDVLIDGNRIRNGNWVIISVEGTAANDIVDVTITNNKFRNCGSSIHLVNTLGATIMGNTARDLRPGSGFAGYASAVVTIRSSSAVDVSHNVLRATSPAVSQAVLFKETTTLSAAKDNIIRGWTTPVTVEAGSTATVSGTI